MLPNSSVAYCETGGTRDDYANVYQELALAGYKTHRIRVELERVSNSERRCKMSLFAFSF